MEKALIGIGLVALSSFLYFFVFLILGDFSYIKKYVLVHFAFLPIHALALSVILEELLSFREKRLLRRKLNMFLGIFFRQMGIDFYVTLADLAENREELEDITTVEPDWTPRRFREARRKLALYHVKMKAEASSLQKVFEQLRAKEDEIVAMTRNPNLWEYEDLYRCLVALFHLIEESHFHGKLESQSAGVLNHLAEDVGKTLLRLLGLWLQYLEFLKESHPVLFRYQMGMHNMVQPVIMEADWDK
jgi:hypothetical protein